MSRYRRVLVIAAGAALAVGSARTAAAQDVRVEVVLPRIVIPQVVVQGVMRDVERLVQRAVSEDVLRDVAGAVRLASDDLARLGRLRAYSVQRGQATQFPVERERRETRSVRLGTDGWLDLSNMTGDISIVAGGGQTAQVEIRRVSRGRTEADAERGLEQVQVEITERGGTRASIETRYPPQRNPPYRVSVSYAITVPRGTRLAIKNVAGAVTTRGIRGDQEIDVVSGDVTVTDAARISSAKTIAGAVTITGANTDGLVEVGSAAGSVTLRDIRARRLHASVVSGTLNAQGITCTELELTSMAGNVEFQGPLAQRGRYNIQSYSGRIRFLPIGRVGFDLRAETFAGMIDLDPPATVPVSGSRRSLRSTLGDGGAAVTLQTFSGTIVIIRK